MSDKNPPKKVKKAAPVTAEKPAKKAKAAPPAAEAPVKTKAERIAAKKAKKERLAKKAAKAEKADGGEKKAKVPDAIVGAESSSIKGYLKLAPKDTCAKARSLFTGLQKDYVSFSALMYVIKEREDYKSAGYERYKDFIETEFHVSVRSVFDKVASYTTLLLEHKQDEGKVNQLGPTKAQVLTNAMRSGILSAKKLPATIDKALNLTEKELKSSLKMVKKGGSGESEDNPNPKEVAGEKGKGETIDFSARLVGKNACELFQTTVEQMNSVEGQGKEVSGSEFIQKLCLEYQASTIKDHKLPVEYFVRQIQSAYPKWVILALPDKYKPDVQEFLAAVRAKDGGKKTKSQGKNPKVPKDSKEG